MNRVCVCVCASPQSCVLVSDSSERSNLGKNKFKKYPRVLHRDTLLHIEHGGEKNNYHVYDGKVSVSAEEVSLLESH